MFKVPNQAQQTRFAIVGVARRMLDGTEDLILGCRAIMNLAQAADMALDGPFAVVRGFEAETDDYPVGDDVRQRYDVELLSRMDQSVKAYVERSRPVVLKACTELVRMLTE